MKSIKNEKTIKEIIRENILQITILGVSFAISIINLMLADKLSPLEKSVSIVVEKVNAMESKQNNYVTQRETDQRFGKIDKSLERIEKLLDTYMYQGR